MNARTLNREERAARLADLRAREAARKVVLRGKPLMELPVEQRIAFAIFDPGAIVPRGDNYTEPVYRWQARAVTYVLSDERAAAVAAQGALPPPVGDQPQPLDDTRLAEIAARAAHLYEYVPMPVEADHLAGEDVPALLAAVTYHRHWEQVGWQKAHAYNERWGRDNDRLAEERHLVARLRQELSRQGRAHKAEIERLKAELAEAHQKKAAVLASARQLMNRNRTEEAS